MCKFSVVFMYSLLAGTCIKADLLFNVSLDTSLLHTSSAAPFYLAFQLAPGDVTYNNLATLAGFNFGTGSPVSVPTFLLGSASGSLATGVKLGDASPVNFFAQQFSPGTRLSFSVDLPTNTGGGVTPDSLAMYILDGTDTPIPTTAGAGSDYLFAINADASFPDLQTFGGDPSRSPAAGGPPLDLPAPVIAFAMTTPEPSTLQLLAVGILLLFISRRHSSQRKLCAGLARTVVPKDQGRPPEPGRSA